MIQAHTVRRAVPTLRPGQLLSMMHPTFGTPGLWQVVDCVAQLDLSKYALILRQLTEDALGHIIWTPPVAVITHHETELHVVDGVRPVPTNVTMDGARWHCPNCGGTYQQCDANGCHGLKPKRWISNLAMTTSHVCEREYPHYHVDGSCRGVAPSLPWEDVAEIVAVSVDDDQPAAPVVPFQRARRREETAAGGRWVDPDDDDDPRVDAGDAEERVLAAMRTERYATQERERRNDDTAILRLSDYQPASFPAGHRHGSTGAWDLDR